MAMPSFSASSDRIYFLEGDSTIQYIGLDGSTGTAKTLSLGTRQAAAFAVSADDKTIVISILDYSTTPSRLHVYQEDLIGSSSDRDLFTSTSEYEWPIGFVGGDLLFAIGTTIVPQVGDGPYGAVGGYRLRDASGGIIGAFCAGTQLTHGFGSAWGGVFPDGVACWQGPIESGAPVLVMWNGEQVNLPNVECTGASVASPARSTQWSVVSYSPDRSSLLCGFSAFNAPDWDYRVVTRTGGLLAQRSEPANVQSTVFGYDWVGDDHVVIGSDILDIRSGTTVPIPWPSSVVGVVPGQLYESEPK